MDMNYYLASQSVFVQNIYTHPIETLTAVLLFAAAIIIVLMLSFIKKTKKLENRQTQTFTRFIGYICEFNDNVYEIDLESGRKQEYTEQSGKINVEDSTFDLKSDLLNDIHPDDKKAAEQVCSLWALKNLFRAGNSKVFEARTKCPSGEYKWYSYTVIPFRPDEEHSYSMMLLKKDIDATKDNDEKRDTELGEANKRVQEAEIAKKTFIGNITHDIRTPLTSISGMTEIAENNVRNQEKVSECLSKIDDSVQYLIKITNDLSDLSHLENEEIVLHSDKCIITGMISDVIGKYAIASGKKNISIMTDRSGIISNFVYCDKRRLEQVLGNLMSNAVKYTPEGGSIDFTITEKKQDDDTSLYSFAVTDNGIGMPHDMLEKVFMPFVRSEDARSMEQGSGLGLYIVDKFVRIMGGKVSVESEIGRGSRFVVSIPLKTRQGEPDDLKDNAETYAAAVQRTHTPGMFNGKTILLVEDNRINSEVAKESISMYGAKVECAYDGLEALKMFEASQIHCYDIILMDIRMPTMDGLQATKAIRGLDREDAKTVPILALSASSYTTDIEDALKSGINDYLSKPIDTPVLLDAISKWTSI